MRQNKEQTQVLLWAAISAIFLYLLFQLRVMEDIGHSPFIPWLALLLLAMQVVNHEQAAISLRKKAPNFTNSFYPENGRMIIGNVIASALVLELNTFNYEQVRLNFSLELISIPFFLIIIFFMENSKGGFLTLDRIYFPKKWDLFVKNYGVNLLSFVLISAMWLPVIFKLPMSALLWILMSALLLKQSVVYTNKYNHQGWCFLLEGLLVMHLLTLGFQERNLWLIGGGVLAGVVFLGIYTYRMKLEKGLIVLSILLFLGGLFTFYQLAQGNRSMVYYFQVEAALMTGIFALMKAMSFIYQKGIKRRDISKYSYEGAVVEKNRPEWKQTSQEEGKKKQTLLKVKEKPVKGRLRSKKEQTATVIVEKSKSKEQPIAAQPLQKREPTENQKQARPGKPKQSITTPLIKNGESAEKLEQALPGRQKQSIAVQPLQGEPSEKPKPAMPEKQKQPIAAQPLQGEPSEKPKQAAPEKPKQPITAQPLQGEPSEKPKPAMPEKQKQPIAAQPLQGEPAENQKQARPERQKQSIAVQPLQGEPSEKPKPAMPEKQKQPIAAQLLQGEPSEEKKAAKQKKRKRRKKKKLAVLDLGTAEQAAMTPSAEKSEILKQEKPKEQEQKKKPPKESSEQRKQEKVLVALPEEKPQPMRKKADKAADVISAPNADKKKPSQKQPDGQRSAAVERVEKKKREEAEKLVNPAAEKMIKSKGLTGSKKSPKEEPIKVRAEGVKAKIKPRLFPKKQSLLSVIKALSKEESVVTASEKRRKGKPAERGKPILSGGKQAPIKEAGVLSPNLLKPIMPPARKGNKPKPIRQKEAVHALSKGKSAEGTAKRVAYPKNKTKKLVKQADKK